MDFTAINEQISKHQRLTNENELDVEKYKIGIIAGNFDVIHPGYIKMFKECK